MTDLATMLQLAIDAWPALEIADVDGWLWRASGGGSKRGNSTVTHRFTGSILDAAIDSIEHRYRALDRPVRFQIDDISAPADLADRLAARGYAIEEVTITMARSVRSEAEATAICEQLPAPTEDWLSVYLSAITPDRREMNQQILRGVPGPRAFFLHRVDGQPVSTGLCVAARRHAIVECMATRADVRRTGGALAILADIEAWAASRGAHTLFLQVVDGNVPAQALYARAGYTPVAQTRYLVRA